MDEFSEIHKTRTDSMTKPKNMTPEQEDAWMKKKKDYQHKWHIKNAAKVIEKVTRWRANNPVKVKNCAMTWAKRNSEKVKQSANAWVKRNPAKAKEVGRRNRMQLADCYIAQRLNIPTDLLRKYPDLLESHREVIRFKRKIYQQTQP